MIDSLDEQLINLLARNANQRSNTIANQLNVSSSTVRRRIKQLTKQGVLRIVAIPEPDKIGLPLQAIISFDVDHDKLDFIMKKLGKRPEVKWLSATTGRFDIIALVWFPSTDKLFSFMETEISKLEGVRNTETFICLHVTKSF